MENVRYIIFGVGGFGREVLTSMIDAFEGTGLDINKSVFFMDEDPTYKGQIMNGVQVLGLDELKLQTDEVIIAVGDPKTRQLIVEKLPSETRYFSIIHPSAIISKWVKIGKGSIITAGCILTCNIEIGDHCHLNLNTTVGHDCIIGDYFTTAPAVNISGACNIGNRVYFGTSASIRQGLKVQSNVTVGMGAIVVKSLEEEGVYIGNPAKKL